MALRKAAQDPARLRAVLGLTKPPVIAREVAAALGLTVESLRASESGFLHALTYTLNGKPRIVVDARKPESVVNFGIAHELYEAILPETVRGKERHLRANRLAADLLLPEEWVRTVVDDLQFNVVALAERFRVSCEAMALRLVQFFKLGATVIDNGQVVRRVASEGLALPATLLPEEKSVLRRLAAGAPDSVEAGSGVKVVGFRVPGDSPVLRFILLTFPTEL
jgi:hypothetical protein